MTTVQWFIDFVMFIGVVTKESRCLVTTWLSKKAKLRHVALSEVKMDCRCRKLSPFPSQFLSAVGKSEKDCRHIFEQCRLSPKPLGRPLSGVGVHYLKFTSAIPFRDMTSDVGHSFF